jgi:bacterioferritin
MNVKEKLLSILNALLAEELTAINQYMVHSEMYENWGYSKLQIAIRKKAMDEMHHVVWLIERIIFYDGSPLVSRLNSTRIGKTVSEMINYDKSTELDVINSYNDAIKFAHEVDDQGTVELLSKILKNEEKHVDWAEKQRTQIGQFGMENYLMNQSEYLLN